MRFAISSDIHFHLPWFDKVNELAVMLRERELDLFILAGDLGEPIGMFNRCLDSFAKVAPRLAALAGNHDVWHREGPLTSTELWEGALQEAAENFGYVWLDAGNLIMDDIGFAGGIAWYDYSARDPKVKFTPDEYERLKPMISNDGNYVDWNWTDRQFAELSGNAILSRMELLEADPAIKHMVLVTHVPLFDGCLRYTEGAEQVIANAYYGNHTLGEQILRFPKLRMALAGHIHRERHVMVDRNDDMPPLPVYTNPSDYGMPAALVIDSDTWNVEIIRTSKEGFYVS